MPRYRLTWSVNGAPEVSTDVIAVDLKDARDEAREMALDCFESNSYWKAELIEEERDCLHGAYSGVFPQ